MRIFDRFKKVMGLGATTPIVQPATLTAPIASQGAYVAPLTTADPNIASLPLGYPPSQATPLSAGGIPVDIKQTNGFWNLLSQFIVWINTGGQWTFDPAVVTANGGYNKGQILWCASVQRYLLSLVNNNTANFLTNPNYINDGVNWVFAELPSIADDLKGNITVKGNLSAQQGNFNGLLSALAGLAITGSGTLNNKNIATTDMIPTYPDITDSKGLVSITGAGGLSVPNGTFTSESIIDNGSQVATSKPLMVNNINTQGNGLIANFSNSSIYYNKFATGWISQGGVANLANNVATITFPLAFTQKVFSINVTTCGETQTSTGWVAVGNATTLTSFLVRSSSAVTQNQQFYWRAEGY